MINIRFQLSPSGDVSGFDLGHIEVHFNGSILTSKNRIPDQSMMVFLSIVGLLDGLRAFFRNKRQGKYIFTGVDCSFFIEFRRGSNKRISININNDAIGEVDQAELMDSVHEGCSHFIDEYLMKLPGSDPVREDVLATLERCMPRRGSRHNS